MCVFSYIMKKTKRTIIRKTKRASFKKMNPMFTWIKIGSKTQKIDGGVCCVSRKHTQCKQVVDIMGALVQSQVVFNQWLKEHIQLNTRICISGELKDIDDGRPASNFRYTKDSILNENVVHNYMSLFNYVTRKQSRYPIFVNTIPRDWRLFSFNIDSCGIIKTTKIGSELFPYTDVQITELLQSFLDSFNIHNEQLQKLRESCCGSKYNTYLIDMISFLYQIKNTDKNVWTYFEKVIRRPSIVPKDCVPYLYMKKNETVNKCVFMVPNMYSVYSVYIDFTNALSLYDNAIKQKIRSYVNDHYIQRWSDFDVNDIDDALTILMIMNAYKCKVNLTKNERNIVSSLKSQMAPWFQQLI
jgi:hypothetical protein